jgi:hypothetical protein
MIGSGDAVGEQLPIDLTKRYGGWETNPSTGHEEVLEGIAVEIDYARYQQQTCRIDVQSPGRCGSVAADRGNPAVLELYVGVYQSFSAGEYSATSDARA